VAYPINVQDIKEQGRSSCTPRAATASRNSRKPARNIHQDKSGEERIKIRIRKDKKSGEERRRERRREDKKG
jgi:hypothetical protein